MVFNSFLGGIKSRQVEKKLQSIFQIQLLTKIQQISAYAAKLYICSHCTYSPENWTLLQLNTAAPSHRQTAPPHRVLPSSEHTRLPRGLHSSWCWNNRFMWALVCVCVRECVFLWQTQSCQDNQGWKTWTVSQGALDDSEMNNNELAECQVQNIRDEPEPGSTAVRSRVCMHNCVNTLRKCLNMSRIPSCREEHPIRSSCTHSRVSPSRSPPLPYAARTPSSLFYRCLLCAWWKSKTA